MWHYCINSDVDKYFKKIEPSLNGELIPLPSSYNYLHAIRAPLEVFFINQVKDFYTSLYIKIEGVVVSSNSTVDISTPLMKLGQAENWKIIQKARKQSQTTLTLRDYFEFRVYRTDSIGFLPEAIQKLHESEIAIDYEIKEFCGGIYDLCAVIIFRSIQKRFPAAPINLVWYCATAETAMNLLQQGFPIAGITSESAFEIQLANSPEKALNTTIGISQGAFFLFALQLLVEDVSNSYQDKSGLTVTKNPYVPIAFFKLNRRKLQGKSLFEEATIDTHSVKQDTVSHPR